MKNSYYERYWNNEICQKAHASTTPNWQTDYFNKFYNAIYSYIGINILDYGCGDGQFMLLLKDKFKRSQSIKGVDISKTAISMAREKGQNVSIIDDNNIIPFKDNTFDTIFMTDVIEHVLDTDSILNEINRVLKNNGTLIIITPDYNFLKKLLIATLFWDKFFHPNSPHIRFFTKSSLTHILKTHGFDLTFYKWGLTWFNIMPQNSFSVFRKHE
jgi:ubiquinone/menaquinone biosynthesis C-methylase UbiE